MIEELKKWLHEQVEEHKDGTLMSMHESVQGALAYARVIAKIEEIEKNSNPEFKGFRDHNL